MSKIMKSNELLANLKNGDLVYSEHGDSHDGWKMFVNNQLSGINTKCTGSYTSDIEFLIKNKRIKKVIFLTDVVNNNNFANFLHGFSESFASNYITTIEYKSDKEEQIEIIISDLSSQLDNAIIELKKIRGEL